MLMGSGRGVPFSVARVSPGRLKGLDAYTTVSLALAAIDLPYSVESRQSQSATTQLDRSEIPLVV